MTALENLASLELDTIQQAAILACSRIAPTWPLDRFIAVNPFWQRLGQSWEELARTLAQRSGSQLTLNAEDYQQAWQEGRIAERHLQAALAESAESFSVAQLHHLLAEPGSRAVPLQLLSDGLMDEQLQGRMPTWHSVITHQISQFCAAWFDEDQADWHLAHRDSLYLAWRDGIVQDRGLIRLTGLTELNTRAAALPSSCAEVLALAAQRFELTTNELDIWFDTLLLRINGWASWCAYQGWQARLNGSSDPILSELLAIRVAWELLVNDGQRHPAAHFSMWRKDWQAGLERTPDAPWLALLVWQRADELAWQEQLLARLAKADSPKPGATSAALARAYFCIDVRSEVYRRALEQANGEVITGGFAGFFGLPIEYRPLATCAVRPQLPGLLAPALQVSDTTGHAHSDEVLSGQRQTRLTRAGYWQVFERLPASAFSLVETLGLAYAGKLIGRSLGFAKASSEAHHAGLNAKQVARLKPVLATDTVANAQLVSRVLHAMSLTADFPPLVLLVGHGSQSDNNPQAAALDCGACCGQTGEVNARVLAGLLNDPAIRLAMAVEGLQIPDSCHFLAALHNTTTDAVKVFDSEQLPAHLLPAWKTMRTALDQATLLARRERAGSLGLGHLTEQPAALAKAVQRRASDWAQTRPEWGLANNAAFIVAPRERTRCVDLQGRAFLHDYAWQADGDGSVLELIMTAPMIVTHWINMQYLASTTDNHRYGSGNKILHNVVGGRIGVFEGNGGDLRIGLAMQSLHDGEGWMHTPLRLTVVIDAPQAMIDTVIAKHDAVRQLVENQWLYLLHLEPGSQTQFQRRTSAGWQAVGDL